MKKMLVAFLVAVAVLLPACGGDKNKGNTSSSLSSSSVLHQESSSMQESSSILESSSMQGSSSIADSSFIQDSSIVEDSSNKEEPCTHADGDDNGMCDECTVSLVYTFDFFGLNDLHGKFDDTDTQIGVDELSTYLQQTKAKNPYTIILSSGDMWQGSPESNLTRGAIMTEWMNEMGFASMTMGNHEYDWGREAIESNATLAKFPFLGINIVDKETGERVDYCQPSVTVEINGAKIGIIGAIGDCLSSISGAMSKDIIFKTGGELSALVKAESNKLREEGVDFIIYSVHGDYTEYDEELSNGYVDLVFEGHSHANYRKQDAYGVWHLQNGGDNESGISHAQISLNYVTGSVDVLDAGIVYQSEYEDMNDHPIVDELLGKYAEQIDVQSKILGENARDREGGEIRQTCAKLYYYAGNQRWGDAYDIVLGGGFLSVRAPYTLYSGTLTYGDLMSILPFDNGLALCSILGSDLKTNFIYNSNSNYFIHYGTYGNTVKDSIDDNATYYIIADAYSYSYPDNHLTVIEEYDSVTFARDLLAQYIEKGGWSSNPPADPEEKFPEDSEVNKQAELITISKALEIGYALADNQITSVKYRVRGEIIDIEPFNTTYNRQFGNMTIRDGEGNTLYIYGTKDSAGNYYGDMTGAKPQVGDVVTLEAPIQKYVKEGNPVKIELQTATLIEFVTLTSIPTALEIGEGLTGNAATTESYYVMGKIVGEITSLGNLYIQDENTQEIYVYKLADYQKMTVKPQVGDRVILYGKIQNYNGTVELSKPTLYAII